MIVTIFLSTNPPIVPYKTFNLLIKQLITLPNYKAAVALGELIRVISCFLFTHIFL